MTAADSALPRLSAFVPAGRALAPARAVRQGAGTARPHRTRPGGMPSRAGRQLTLLAVVLAHAGGAYFLARAAQIEPVVAAAPIQVALMSLPLALPAVEPPQMRPAPPVPEPRLRPPPPEPAKSTRPAKPPSVPKPHPAAMPRPAPQPLSPAPTALSAPAPEAVSENVSETAPPQPAAPALAAQAAASGPPALVEARFDADYLANPPPLYPALSRRMREQGRVMLRVRVTEQGLPATIELSASSGSARLDAAAQQAVARWRFVPARRGQQVVESWVLVPVVFKLEGS